MEDCLTICRLDSIFGPSPREWLAGFWDNAQNVGVSRDARRDVTAASNICVQIVNGWTHAVPTHEGRFEMISLPHRQHLQIVVDRRPA